MTFLLALEAIGGVFALFSLLGAAFVVARSAATKASAEAWRGEAEAQKARADRLESALDDLKIRVAALETDNRRLTDMATGATAIHELTELVKVQHQQTVLLLSGHGGVS